MARRRQIYEGKAKILYEGPEPGTLIQYFKDDATAFNAQKKGTIAGKGVINILAADQLMNSPRLYATFLLWMLSELFEQLPEVGDLDQPKLVFFFDEAHLLFKEAPAIDNVMGGFHRHETCSLLASILALPSARAVANAAAELCTEPPAAGAIPMSWTLMPPLRSPSPACRSARSR